MSCYAQCQHQHGGDSSTVNSRLLRGDCLIACVYPPVGMRVCFADLNQEEESGLQKVALRAVRTCRSLTVAQVGVVSVCTCLSEEFMGQLVISLVGCTPVYVEAEGGWLKCYNCNSVRAEVHVSGEGRLIHGTVARTAARGRPSKLRGPVHAKALLFKLLECCHCMV